MDFILLLAGLAIIIKSADVLIGSTSKLAQRYGVSTFVIGITVVAFGTSAPELAVGLVSAISKANQITLGNVVGSSYSNMAMILGISAMLSTLAVKDTMIKREIPMLIGVQIVLAAMVFSGGFINRIEGILLVIGFVGFVLYIIIDARKSMIFAQDKLDTPDADSSDDIKKSTDTKKLYVFSVLSLAGLFAGGKLAVDCSTRIAANFGLSETIIGLTVVAIATTLPELTASIMAVRQKEPDIVLGNCVGSNLFNILFVLGASSVINPIEVQGNMLPDMIFMISLTVAVFLIALITKRVARWFGMVLVASYVIYIGIKVVLVLA